jgi:hypothetical protein
LKKTGVDGKMERNTGVIKNISKFKEDIDTK